MELVAFFTCAMFAFCSRTCGANKILQKAKKALSSEGEWHQFSFDSGLVFARLEGKTLALRVPRQGIDTAVALSKFEFWRKSRVDYHPEAPCPTVVYMVEIGTSDKRMPRLYLQGPEDECLRFYQFLRATVIPRQSIRSFLLDQIWVPMP